MADTTVNTLGVLAQFTQGAVSKIRASAVPQPFPLAEQDRAREQRQAFESALGTLDEIALQLLELGARLSPPARADVEGHLRNRNYEPQGVHFYDSASGRDMLLVDESEKQFAGWLCFRHPDGQWVSLRKATHDDRLKIAAMPRYGPTVVA